MVLKNRKLSERFFIMIESTNAQFINAIIQWDNVKNVNYTECGATVEFKSDPCNIDAARVAVIAVFKEVAQLKKQTAHMEEQIKDLQDENKLLKDYVSLLEPVRSAEKK